jgi:DNA-binding MarR family transcriptional regulator
VTLHLLGSDLDDLGLTASEINVLANLGDRRTRTVSALATAVGSRSSTLTSVLDRLENRRLVSRAPSPEDRRAVLISLTPSGRTAASTVTRAVRRLERQLLADLSDDAVEHLHAGLRAMAGDPS